MRQRQVSPETIASYRDTFCLLFRFVRHHLNKAPSVLEIEDLDGSLIVAFLCWLEKERGNCARSRNARLAAIHSFFRYAAYMIQLTAVSSNAYWQSRVNAMIVFLCST
jgi:integrase/recombinase XerD